MRSDTIPLALFCEDHMFRLFDARDRLHVGMYDFACHVDDA